MHHNINQLLWIRKLYGPCCFYTKCLHQNDEMNPKICCAHTVMKEVAFQRRTKCCYTHGYHERRGASMVFQAVQACWKKIRCPPVTPPEAGFISWAQQEWQLGFAPQKPVSLTGFTACCYMPLRICATVCESFLSYILYRCLSVPMQFLSLLYSCFYRYVLVGQQWVKPMDAGLS